MLSQTKIDKPGAAYKQVAARIRDQIQEGALTDGAVLPTYREIAQKYDVGFTTVQQAVGLLVSEGHLAVIGKRVTVTNPHAPTAKSPSLQRTSKRGEASTAVAPKRNLHVGIIGSLPDDHAEKLPEYYIPYEISKYLERYVAAASGMTSFRPIRAPHPFNVPLRREVDTLLAKGVTAIVLIGMDKDELAGGVLQTIHEAGVLAIGACTDDIRLPIQHVFYDSRHSGLQVGRHLIDQGCKRILFVSLYCVEWANNRLLGVRDAVDHFGKGTVEFRPVTGNHVESLPDDQVIALTAELTRTLVDPLKETFTGVACGNDMQALAFMDEARLAGLVAGEDYLIVGFDDTPQARVAGLSTVPSPAEDISHEVVRLILGETPVSGMTSRISVYSNVLARETSMRNRSGKPLNSSRE